MKTDVVERSPMVFVGLNGLLVAAQPARVGTTVTQSGGRR